MVSQESADVRSHKHTQKEKPTQAPIHACIAGVLVAKVFFHEDEWHPVTGVWDPGGCPPGNILYLEINLVQSGAPKKD